MAPAAVQQRVGKPRLRGRFAAAERNTAAAFSKKRLIAGRPLPAHPEPSCACRPGSAPARGSVRRTGRTVRSRQRESHGPQQSRYGSHWGRPVDTRRSAGSARYEISGRSPRCPSGLWHQGHWSGQPRRKTTERMPGPSCREKCCISNTSPAISGRFRSFSMRVSAHFVFGAVDDLLLLLDVEVDEVFAVTGDCARRGRGAFQDATARP